MHTAGQTLPLVPPTLALMADPAPMTHRLKVLRRRFMPARPHFWAVCRAATLPPIDELAEACAPEGAIYIDGVLFGRGPTG